ncbi:MAG: RraA family protein [Eubacteriales bacterium]|nr:RraA family protein [Eubacteriales bacterium]
MTYQEENQKLIELFKPCRVTDVRDGMDWCGYHHYGTVDYHVRPLFPARAVGIARTARYIPYEGPAPMCTGEEYTKWSAMYYKEICYDPWQNDLEPGDFMCIDLAGVDVGLMGSNNTLFSQKKGCVGFLINGGGIRDTDEVIMQGGMPVWSYHISQGMDQARIRFIDKDCPIAVGGVAVYPGDVIVADHDGVIVVPRKVAYDVAKYAWQEMNGDKVGRQKLYKDLGKELDDTVVPVDEVK